MTLTEENFIPTDGNRPPVQAQAAFVLGRWVLWGEGEPLTILAMILAREQTAQWAKVGHVRPR